MIDMKVENDILNLAKNLTSKLGDLVKQQDIAINKLPPEKLEMVKSHQLEINQLMRVAKTGDFDKLNKIIQKHANTNN